MLNRYRKSIGALVAAVAGWGIVAAEDGAYTQVEWWGLAVALGGVVAVWGLPNDPPTGQAADPNVSERGAGEVRLIACVAAGVLLAWLVIFLVQHI